jgi:hypothetical protein
MNNGQHLLIIMRHSLTLPIILSIPVITFERLSNQNQ